MLMLLLLMLLLLLSLACMLQPPKVACTLRCNHQARVLRYPPTISSAETHRTYPEATTEHTLRAREPIAAQIWDHLQTASPKMSGHLLVEDPAPLRMLENVITTKAAASLMASAVYDSAGSRPRRDRANVPLGPEALQLQTRVAEAMGVETAFLEPLRLVRYSRLGQTFEEHVDWIVDPQDPQLELLGQRVATALVILESVPEAAGGETDFPCLGIAARPEAGTALLWPNVCADGRPLPELIHEAKPISREGVQKTALNVWVRDRPLPTDPAVLESLVLS